MSDETTPAAAKRPRGRPRKMKVEGEAPPKKTAIRRVRKPVREEPAAPAATPPPSSHVTPLKYVFAVGRRKRAVARVFVHHEGTGAIIVNKKPLTEYFPIEAWRARLVAPLLHTPYKTSVNINVSVSGGGLHGQAGAVRLGIARALLKLDETFRTVFRARGYLTRDPREKERKKPGLKRARRAPQWQKR